MILVACGVQQRYRHEQRRARVDKYVLNKGAKYCLCRSAEPAIECAWDSRSRYSCATAVSILASWFNAAAPRRPPSLHTSEAVLTHVSELAVPCVLPTSWNNAPILENVICNYPEYFVIKTPRGLAAATGFRGSAGCPAGAPGNKAVSTDLATPSLAIPISSRWLTTLRMTQNHWPAS